MLRLRWLLVGLVGFGLGVLGINATRSLADLATVAMGSLAVGFICDGISDLLDVKWL